MAGMERALLVHWKPEEAEPKLCALRDAGFAPELAPHPATPEWKRIFAAPPAAIVIDLDRLPSHGRAVAAALRQRKSTRAVPLVFAGGLPDKVAKAREVVPDGVFCDWSRVGAALRKAARTPVVAPAIPPPHGNTPSPLPSRLGIREDAAVALVGAPARFERKLEPLPEGARVRESVRGEPPSVLLLFVANSLDLARRFDSAAAALAPSGKFWIVWPKRASGVETDLSMPFIRAFVLEAGWVDYKVCSIDGTWSGMLLARKK